MKCVALSCLPPPIHHSCRPEPASLDLNDSREVCSLDELAELIIHIDKVHHCILKVQAASQRTEVIVIPGQGLEEDRLKGNEQSDMFCEVDLTGEVWDFSPVWLADGTINTNKLAFALLFVFGICSESTSHKFNIENRNCGPVFS